MEFNVMSRGPHYPAELRERAIRMVAEMTPDHSTEFAAIRSVAEKLGIGSPETVRKWVRRSQVDAGTRPGVTSEEHAEIKRLKRENAELRRANEILKAASSFFAAELDRPQRYS
jgi:transposase